MDLKNNIELTKNEFNKYLALDEWDKKTALYLVSQIHPKKLNLSNSEVRLKKQWNDRIKQAVKREYLIFNNQGIIESRKFILWAVKWRNQLSNRHDNLFRAFYEDNVPSGKRLYNTGALSIPVEFRVISKPIPTIPNWPVNTNDCHELLTQYFKKIHHLEEENLAQSNQLERLKKNVLDEEEKSLLIQSELGKYKKIKSDCQRKNGLKAWKYQKTEKKDQHS